MPGSGDGDGGPSVRSARLGTSNRFCNASMSFASFPFEVSGFGESAAANAWGVRQVDIISLMRSLGSTPKSDPAGLHAAAFPVRSVAAGKRFIIMTNTNASINLNARSFQFIAVLIIEMVQ